jgi:hypothetical protein
MRLAFTMLILAWLVPAHAGIDSCAASGGLHFVCAAEHPEDLAHIPGTPWLIASGFSDGAGLKLVDTRTDGLRRWYTGAAEQVQHDAGLFPDCPSAPDAAVFNAHGINLKPREGSGYTLYVVNHGGRESIEVFSVAADRAEPGLVWNGCVLLPQGMAANSVAAYRDGTILASVLTRPGTTITDFVAGRKTGRFEERSFLVTTVWRPLATIASSMLSHSVGTPWLHSHVPIRRLPRGRRLHLDSCLTTYIGTTDDCWLRACSWTSRRAAASGGSSEAGPTTCAVIGDSP